MNDIKNKTAATKARYDRIAPVYDTMEWVTERSAFQEWRTKLWDKIPQGHILEIGVGTGKNLPYHPPQGRATAIDLSDRMLDQAQKRVRSTHVKVDLAQMDAQYLGFSANTFDVAVATFVFCSIPLPVQGLKEIKRVVKPTGDIWLLEHVRVNQPIVGLLMDAINPVVVRVMGANINRHTAENVHKAGLEILSVEHLFGELVKMINARPQEG